MKGMSYLWRMALRRKAACLLVVISTAVATVFMLFYPSLIENTRQRLDETYHNITVTGSVSTANIMPAPQIPNAIWHEMEDSGLFSELYGSSFFKLYAFPKELLEEKAGKDASEQLNLLAFQTLLADEERKADRVGGRMLGYNSFEAADELLRIRDDITWLEGYDESCLAGEERICIIPESWGYELGDTISLLSIITLDKSEVEGILRVKVVATYPGKITSLSAAMPLKSMEQLAEDATAAHKEAGNHYTWILNLEDVFFMVKDNQQLDEVKALLQKLRGNDMLSVRLDDKTLKETVKPIESNLAQLEGSFIFFFVMIAAIGFFISFLLARGRKAEYAVMRLLGESRAQITMKALTEQFVLCLVGVAIGALIERNSFDGAICAVILLCYTIGAAAAVMLNVGVNVMDILRDKE